MCPYQLSSIHQVSWSRSAERGGGSCQRLCVKMYVQAETDPSALHGLRLIPGAGISALIVNASLEFAMKRLWVWLVAPLNGTMWSPLLLSFGLNG